jgi:uncharacterized protein YcfJ
MKSKILISAVTLALVAAAGGALADNGRHRGDRGDHGRDYSRDYGRDYNRDHGRGYDYARVLRVEPLVQRVRYSVPVEQCWTEQRVRGGNRSDSTGGAIVGGAVGAILGNTIGRGDGRRAATVGGAVVGAVLGSELARSDGRRDYREPRYEEQQRCRTEYEDRYDERVSGYRVTYEFNGRRQVTQLPYEPGRYLKVAVDVHPLG